MKKYLSCKDLEKSLYIAPNEIRSCCQRFFYKNQMRGDAKLLDIKDGHTPTVYEIKKARTDLFEKIQNNNSKSCNGCPFLYETEKKPNFDSSVNHLSIEHHSVCNLRCTYCSETYYGGVRSKYNVVEFIKYLSENKSFKNCKQVVWGGGEPTLDKSFELIVREIDKYANPNLYHRVFTNSVRYHNAVEEFLKDGSIKIVTSIDSGSSETFKKIRGRDKFFNVFENLKKYSEIDPSKITIKYIFTDGNEKEDELVNFVNYCVKYNLNKCSYQISMNYKYSELKFQNLKKISLLMGLLKKKGIKKFFCDDHIALRFKKIDTKEKNDLIKFLKDRNIDDIILTNGNIEKINFYVIGDIATNFLNKSDSVELFKQLELYDSDENKIGNKVNDFIIKKPEDLRKNSNKIFISTAQSYDDIYQFLKKINIDTERVISGLLI